MDLNPEALVALRKAGGDSQKTLAERAGLSEKSLNLIEQGKTHPRVSTLKKLADALSVPLGAITVPEQTQQAS
jgi:transcriptional regulator with XRE-family HTH domain